MALFYSTKGCAAAFHRLYQASLPIARHECQTFTDLSRHALPTTTRILSPSLVTSSFSSSSRPNTIADYSAGSPSIPRAETRIEERQYHQQEEPVHTDRRKRGSGQPDVGSLYASIMGHNRPRRRRPSSQFITSDNEENPQHIHEKVAIGAPRHQEQEWSTRLSAACTMSDAKAISALFAEIEMTGFTPTTAAVRMALGVAANAGNSSLLLRLLDYLPVFPVERSDNGHGSWCGDGDGDGDRKLTVGARNSGDVEGNIDWEQVGHVRIVAAAALTAAKDVEAAYDALLLPHDLKDFSSNSSATEGSPLIHGNRKSTSSLADTLQALHLRQDAFAWGVVIKALTDNNAAHAAVSTVTQALSSGVRVTDSLLHLSVEALREAGRWRDAAQLYFRAVEKGVTAGERTIGSVLRALTTVEGRFDAGSRGEVEGIVDGAVEGASSRLLSGMLRACGAVGSLDRAERIFAELGVQSVNDGMQDEYAFASVLLAYANFVVGVGDEDEVMRERVYKEVNEKINVVWRRYLQAFRMEAAENGAMRMERELALRNLLLAKVRCFRVEEAVEVLEQLVDRRDVYPCLEVKVFHVGTVLGAVELAGDVALAERLTDVMERGGLRHDMRSLAFCVGVLVADGELGGALRLVREVAPALVWDGSGGGGEGGGDGGRRRVGVAHHRTLFLRRLRALAMAFEDVGVGRVPDVDALVAELEKGMERRGGRRGRHGGAARGGGGRER